MYQPIRIYRIYCLLFQHSFDRYYFMESRNYDSAMIVLYTVYLLMGTLYTSIHTVHSIIKEVIYGTNIVTVQQILYMIMHITSVN